MILTDFSFFSFFRFLNSNNKFGIDFEIFILFCDFLPSLIIFIFLISLISELITGESFLGCFILFLNVSLL